jgi:hypothetical protein
MTLPNLLFGLLLSTLYGAVFHLIRGGGAGRLLLYLILAWTGFWAGQLLAVQLNWDIGSLGSLHVGVATLSSVIFLAVGHWLSLVEAERK